MITNIQDVTVDNVMSVYSGRPHTCCCGCAGKHTYNSKHVKVASRDRGYKVTPAEIGDRTVALVLNKLKRNSTCIDMYPHGAYNFFSGIVGNRLYVVYMLPVKKQ